MPVLTYLGDKRADLMRHAYRYDCHRENPVASYYPLDADSAGVCDTGMYHDPVTGLTPRRENAAGDSRRQLVFRRDGRERASVRAGISPVSGGGELSVLCQPPPR